MKSITRQVARVISLDRKVALTLAAARRCSPNFTEVWIAKTAELRDMRERVLQDCRI
jgi:hypothetical protein